LVLGGGVRVWVMATAPEGFVKYFSYIEHLWPPNPQFWGNRTRLKPL
jgi:hypothetical protein